MTEDELQETWVIVGKCIVRAKVALCRQKALSSNRELYNSTRTLRNVGSQRRLERLLAEALSCQLLCRFRGASEPGHELASPVQLRLETADRGGCVLAVDPVVC